VPDAPQDPFALVGQLLDGQYRVDTVVGEGGFGVVYKGWHLSFDQPIAIKALKLPQAVDAAMQNSVLAKFREEAKLCYVLSQASLNIVRSIGFGAITTPSGIWAPFVILEWLEGRALSTDLTERRDRGMRGRTLAETVDMLDPAARGLAYAHSMRVAHRDVKPANMFITELSGEKGKTTIKLLDFGIAKVMAEGATAASPQAATAFSSFTPFYAAPEQFDPRLGPTGPWTDVYAFALVLTEVMTDRPAVDEEDVLAIIARATDAKRRPTPRANGARITDAVEAVFVRALAVDPKARYADVATMWSALLASARLPITASSRAELGPPAQSAIAATLANLPARQNQTAPMQSVPGRQPPLDTLPMASLPNLQVTAPLPAQGGSVAATGSTSWPSALPAGRPAPESPQRQAGVQAPASAQAGWPLPPVRPSAASSSYSAGGQAAPWQGTPANATAERARSSGTTVLGIVVGVLLVLLVAGLAWLTQR
jgi:serine/threonine protein kinase